MAGKAYSPFPGFEVKKENGKNFPVFKPGSNGFRLKGLLGLFDNL